MLNLHIFVDREENSNNSILMKMVNNGLVKNKFNLLFALSCLRERFKYERSQGYYYFSNDLLYVSDQDLIIYVDDLMQFLTVYPQNPFIFMNKYFEFIFS